MQKLKAIFRFTFFLRGTVKVAPSEHQSQLNSNDKTNTLQKISTESAQLLSPTTKNLNENHEMKKSSHHYIDYIDFDEKYDHNENLNEITNKNINNENTIDDLKYENMSVLDSNNNNMKQLKKIVSNSLSINVENGNNMLVDKHDLMKTLKSRFFKSHISDGDIDIENTKQSQWLDKKISKLESKVKNNNFEMISSSPKNENDNLLSNYSTINGNEINYNTYISDQDINNRQEIFDNKLICNKEDTNEPLTKKITNIHENNQKNLSHNTIRELDNENDDPLDYEFQKRKIARLKKIISQKFRENPKYAGISWILYPDDNFRQFWDIVIILLMMYTSILMPPLLAYSNESLTSGWQILDNIVDCLFFLDVIINFFTAYFDRDNKLVVELKVIAKNYATGWFILDIFSIIPFDFLVENININFGSLVRFTRLPRLYRLVKIGKVIRMVKIFNQDKNKFVKVLHDFFRVKNEFERLFNAVMGMIITTHIAACLWHILLLFNDNTYESWLFQYELLDQTLLEIYIAEFYFIVQTVTTVGYGDLHPNTPSERLFSVFIMFIGAFIYSFIIGSLSSLILNSEKNQLSYNQKLTVLLDIKKTYNISNPLYFKCKNAIKCGIKDYADYRTFLNELPESLQTEVSDTFFSLQIVYQLAYIMHMESIANIYFFDDKPKSFIAFIGPFLKPVKVMKNEYIFMSGDPAEEMYFIKSGAIVYVLESFQNLPFLKIRKGYYFGELDLLFYGEIRKYTAKALEDCELLILNKKNFKNVFFVEFRNIGQQIFNNACKRKVATKKIYKEAIKNSLRSRSLGGLPEWGDKIPSSVSLINQLTMKDNGMNAISLNSSYSEENSLRQDEKLDNVQDNDSNNLDKDMNELDKSVIKSDEKSIDNFLDDELNGKDEKSEMSKRDSKEISNIIEVNVDNHGMILLGNEKVNKDQIEQKTHISRQQSKRSENKVVIYQNPEGDRVFSPQEENLDFKDVNSETKTLSEHLNKIENSINSTISKIRKIKNKMKFNSIAAAALHQPVQPLLNEDNIGVIPVFKNNFMENDVPNLNKQSKILSKTANKFRKIKDGIIVKRMLYKALANKSNIELINNPKNLNLQSFDQNEASSAENESDREQQQCQ